MAITRTDQLYRQNEHSAVIAHGAHPEYRLEFPAEVDGTDANFAKIYQGSVVSLNANGEYVCGCGVGSGINFPVPCISLKNVFDPDVTTGKLGTSPYSAITADSKIYYRIEKLDTAISSQAYYAWKSAVEDTVVYTQTLSIVANSTKIYTIAAGSATQGATITAFADVATADYRKTTYSAVGGKITAIPCTGGYEIETTEIDTAATYNVNDALVAGTGDLIGKLVPATVAGNKNPYAAGNTTAVLGFVSRSKFVVPSYQQNRISFWTNFIPAAHSA